ncbi:hypothetical protein [Psychroserpens ponticola]|uniref:Uncharacterized protein n=1 Tax=Psychroserpens ponticola TaxID=2932268 RepID=A0ABY7S2K1_9FLAO|nr:hypothetical protein [Psychroserpens ponticola]WCO03629.1 hypothetical protein MUN68_008980 [Psychroserpens ponticola]
MDIEYENLRNTIKRKHSFKYIPEYSESFKTGINETQIIPLIIEVLEKLEWSIVYHDEKSVEAKCKGDFSKLVGKLTINKINSNRIEINSKSLEGGFWDFGKNSKRTGLFIALFKKLEQDYQANGKLVELENEYRKQNNWDDYEIPNELPKPKISAKPNIQIAIIGGLIIAIAIGSLVGFLSLEFTYYIFLTEVGIGFLFGYLLSEILKKSNIMDYNKVRIMAITFIFIIFLVNHYFQYYLIISKNNISDLSFIEFHKYLLNKGFIISTFNTSWIGFLIIWVLQLVIPYFISIFIISTSLMKYSIKKIPEQVIEYTIFLFQKDKNESEVRAELAQKGWNKKSDQDDVILAISSIVEFNEFNRD